MKKLLAFSILFILNFTFINAQEDDKITPAIDKKHEVRLGAVKLLSSGIIEGVYEYVQDSNRGFGAALLLNIDSGNEYIEDYSITPFYRMYFQTKEDYGAKGFFVEGFTSFFGGKNYDLFDFDSNQSNDENFFDISVGLGLGKKWINSAGFVFEIKFGAGRNLLNGSEFDALFKGDLYIGYRF
ncbi:hypothetical protein [Olleya sp. YS]|uniref:hypothetical protein n=1 Tax=Olleya sp. YS TaxID=3028318 RepID=UPI0024345F96|nr:hypothetical protein [Olleya sp. YS]WGD36019.1 hypothetical protein Ollyesu_06280 [Olleya sp. YS]